MVVRGVGAVLVVVAAALLGCVQVVGSGVAKTEARAIGDFHAIEGAGSLRMVITLGPRPACTLTADDNVLPILETTVQDGVLRLSSRKGYDARTPVVATITAPRLDAIGLSGSGAIELVDVNTDRLAVDISGSGTVSGTGRIQALTIGVSGSGKADLARVPTEAVEVDVSGSGELVLDVSRTLDVRVSGSGTVLYRGNPSITQSISGSGALRRL